MMIRSMTAFSRIDREIEGDNAGHMSWEVRSVNHRYLDISLYLPDGFLSMENDLKSVISKKLKRGKVDASLRYQLSDDKNSEILIHEASVKSLLNSQKKLEKLANQKLALTTMDILQWRGVVKQAPLVLDHLFGPVTSCLSDAVDELLKARQNEGQQLCDLILQRCEKIEKIIVDVRSRRKQVMQALREKFLKRMADIDMDVDNKRLEQELVFYAQRLDVDEELDRLDAHINEVRDVLTRHEAVGRRLDFLMQELNREANTLGSKSNDAQTTTAAVEIKVMIEQMREQVMNIE